MSKPKWITGLLILYLVITFGVLLIQEYRTANKDPSRNSADYLTLRQGWRAGEKRTLFLTK